jgi:MFS family permease
MSTNLSLKAVFTSLFALLLATAVLNIANGSLFTLIGVRLAAELTTGLVGLITSGHFVGLLAGSITATAIIARVGHIRAFTVFAAMAACAVLLMGLIFSVPTWFIFRFVIGYCMAGLFMVLESWFNDRATNETRGRMFALYLVASSAAFAVGPWLINLGDPLKYGLFAMTAILLNLCLLPIALTREGNPQVSKSERLPLKALFALSPLGVIGCFAAGLVNSAVYGLGAVYADLTGLDDAAIAAMFSALVVGGLLMQFPIGWISDRFDRRNILIALALAASVSASLVIAFGTFSPTVLIVLVFIYGGLAGPIYGLSVAQTNDYVAKDQFVAASSGLLIVYAIGAIAGPNVASWIMGLSGAWGLWIYVSAALICLAGFTAYRKTQRAPLPVAEQSAFVPAAGEASVSIDLDPRAVPDTMAADVPKEDG